MEVGLLMLAAIAVLVADLYAIVTTLRSDATDIMKIFWVLLVLFMPVIGLIVWLVAGPRESPA